MIPKANRYIEISLPQQPHGAGVSGKEVLHTETTWISLEFAKPLSAPQCYIVGKVTNDV